MSRAKYRRLLVALIAALATTGIVSVASASAAQWYWEFAPLKTAKEISSTIKVEEPIEYTYWKGTAKEPGSKLFVVKCTAVETQKSKWEIVPTGSLKLGELALSGCKVTYPAGQEAKCKFKSPAFGSAPLAATLELGTGTEDKGTLKRGEAGPFGEWVAVENEWECPEGSFLGNVYGSEEFSLPTGRTESEEQVLTFKAGTGLTAGGSGFVQLSGKIKLKLPGFATWSSH